MTAVAGDCEVLIITMEERGINIVWRNRVRIRGGRRIRRKTGASVILDNRLSFRDNRINLRMKRCLAVSRQRKIENRLIWYPAD